MSSSTLVALLANEDVSSQPQLMEVSIASFWRARGRVCPHRSLPALLVNPTGGGLMKSDAECSASQGEGGF